MKKGYKIFLLSTVFLFLSLLFEGDIGKTLAQNKNIDSLQILITNDKPDTNKVKHLYLLSWHYINIGLYDTGMYYNNKALQLAEKFNFKKGIAASYGNTGVFYKEQGNYPKALEYYFKALKIDKESGNINGVARHFGSIGTIYWIQDDDSIALEYYLKALEITQKVGDKARSGSKIGNIGNIYFKQGKYVQALEYYVKALEIAEELGDESAIPIYLNSIGSIYFNQNKLPEALDKLSKALIISEKLGDKQSEGQILNNIGALYGRQKKYQDAFDYMYRALAISESIGAKKLLKDCYSSLSSLYENSNISLPDSIGGKLLNIEQMRLRSLYYYKQSIAIRDMLFNEENKKQLVRNEMNYEFDKKEAITNAENEKQQAIAQEKNRKQKLILVLVSCVLILVFIFAGLIFRTLRITSKQKQIIEIKNKETEQQKRIIEEKNKDITDSIHYAKQIQEALLREEEHVSMHLPEHFILFIPKDIVSGDFYWGTEKKEFWYFAAVDCTGHGVPGAIMCMLGISFLNDIISSSFEELLNPAEILNRLRDRIVGELRQTGEDGGNRDGMDVSLVRLNLKTNEIQWAGANNSLNFISNGELKKVKGDKQPIGYHPESHPFTNHEIQLQKGDSIYIYSDGYADQFGGPNEKKLGYKKLENLLIIHNHLPMKAQKELFKKRFIEWKGNLEQIDDVCVFGVKI